MMKIDYMSPLFDEEVNDAVICGAAQSGDSGNKDHEGGEGGDEGEWGEE